MLRAKMLWFPTWLLLISVVGATSLQSPEIWHSSFGPEYKSCEFDFPADENFRNKSIYKNDIVDRNGSSYVVSSSNVAYVYFTCQAAYPIMWTVPDIEQLQRQPFTDFAALRTYSRRLSNFSSKSTFPFNNIFQQFLRVDFRDVTFFSVSFTCQEILSSGKSQQFPLSSAIHIYYSLGEQVLDWQGETLSISVPSDSSSALLPCRPASPEMKVTLEKLVGMEWTEPQFENKTFNPQVGFTLRNLPQKDLDGTLGMYRCKVKGDLLDPEEEHFVTFNLTRKATKRKQSKLVSGKSRVRVRLVGKFQNIIECCSDSENSLNVQVQPPSLQIVEACEDYFSCDILRRIIYPRMKAKNQFSEVKVNVTGNCVTTTLLRSSVLVECTGSNSTEHSLELYQTSFVERKSRNEHFKELMTHSDANRLGNISAVNKMLIVVGSDVNCNDDVLKQIRSKKKGFLHRVYENRYSFGSEHDGSGLHTTHILVDNDRTHYYFRDIIWIMCIGFRYFYSDGGYMRLNWKSGAKSVLPFDNPNRYRWFHLQRDYPERRPPKAENRLGIHFQPPEFSAVFAERMQIHSAGKHSIECFLPKWNSTEWDKFSYTFTISKS